MRLAVGLISLVLSHNAQLFPVLHHHAGRAFHHTEVSQTFHYTNDATDYPTAVNLYVRVCACVCVCVCVCANSAMLWKLNFLLLHTGNELLVQIIPS